MGFLIEQVARGSLKPLADLGSRVLGARLQRNESSISSELETVPLLGLMHERLALGTWKRFFDGMARLKPDMQTALMATDEPYSELVNRNTAWLELLQVSKDSFGAQQMQVVRGIEVLRGMGDSRLLDWAAAFSPQERLKDDVVVRQAATVKSFFAIRSGTCTVLRDGAEVATLGPGDHYGGIALLLGVPSSTSLVASTDAKLLEMPGEVFLRLAEREGPELRAALSAPADRFHLGLDGVSSEQDTGRSRVRSLLSGRPELAAWAEEHLDASVCEIHAEGEVVTLDERESLRLVECGSASVVLRGVEMRRLSPGDFFGPGLQPGEQVVAREDQTFVCRFRDSASSAILESIASAAEAATR
jgi:CRP-like cAMP-binding protein